MSSFFVKSDTLNDSVGRRVKSPVILGCNVLRAIADNSMEPMGPSREDWRLALRWIQLVCEPESGSSEGLTIVDTTLKALPHVTISSTISSTIHRRRWF